jgi:hypothetical protein
VEEEGRLSIYTNEKVRKDFNLQKQMTKHIKI